MTIVFKDKELVVPPGVRRRAGIKSGDRLEFKVSGRVITIVPELPSADDEYTPAQRRIIDARLDKAAKSRTHGPFTAAEASRFLKTELDARRSNRSPKPR